MSSDKDYIADEAAKAYGVTRQTIYDWRDNYNIGRLEYNRWVFRRSELDYANERAQNARGGAPRKEKKRGLFG